MATGKDTEDPTAWQQAEATFQNKQSSEYFDPCSDFSQRSMKCLRRNGGDRDLCADYFQKYRDCKKQWLAERAEAKAKARKTSSWF